MNLDLFNDIENNSDAAVNKLLTSLKDTNEAVYNEFESLLYSLEKHPNGLIKGSVTNLKKISSFENKFDSIFKKTPYWSEMTGYIGSFSENRALINEYFKTVAGFNANSPVFSAVVQNNVDVTVNTLMESGISEYFKKPLVNSIRQGIFEGVSKTDLLKTLKSEILGNAQRDPRLDRYVKQVATDAVNQFNGNYIGAISNDLGLSHYFYKGTKKEDTREFCIHLTGKFMKESELREYVNTESSGKGWPGMIPGTNFGNILTRRGGYNCRHTIIPVSKEVYEASKNKL